MFENACHVFVDCLGRVLHINVYNKKTRMLVTSVIGLLAVALSIIIPNKSKIFQRLSSIGGIITAPRTLVFFTIASGIFEIFSGGYNLYTTQWDFAVINQANVKVEIASRHHAWGNDYATQSDYTTIEANATMYITIQPFWTTWFGYTYELVFKMNNSLLMIPIESANRECRTFIITEKGLRLAENRYFRQWSVNHSGGKTFFRASEARVWTAH